MYPCCAIIILILCGVYGVRDKLKVLFKHLKKKLRKEETSSEELKKDLENTKYYSFFERDKEGRYQDGRTQVIDLRNNGS
ncbi:MAG: hypothetical protein J6T14_02890 [Clostridia bacterium]|nr:hypothetical protein [Clostridia bacterium]MBO7689772.1 hypothetical protein [Clostridia bacterium]MBP5459125.1 hypothetical protein [Clostridia bacterium]